MKRTPGSRPSIRPLKAVVTFSGSRAGDSSLGYLESVSFSRSCAGENSLTHSRPAYLLGARAGEIPLGHAQPAEAKPDTIRNPLLEEMLADFEKEPEARELAHDTWTFLSHRYLGYSILALTAAQVVLGFATWGARVDGEDPGTKSAHKYIGYTTAGLSIAQSSLGAYNLWKLRKRTEGRTKRFVHFGLSTLATAGFVTAAALAYDARQDIESGRASTEGKSFQDLYSNHRAIGILSGVSVLLTVAVIEW